MPFNKEWAPRQAIVNTTITNINVEGRVSVAVPLRRPLRGSVNFAGGQGSSPAVARFIGYTGTVNAIIQFEQPTSTTDSIARYPVRPLGSGAGYSGSTLTIFAWGN